MPRNPARRWIGRGRSRNPATSHRRPMVGNSPGQGVRDNVFGTTCVENTGVVTRQNTAVGHQQASWDTAGGVPTEPGENDGMFRVPALSPVAAGNRLYSKRELTVAIDQNQAPIFQVQWEPGDLCLAQAEGPGRSPAVGPRRWIQRSSGRRLPHPARLFARGRTPLICHPEVRRRKSPPQGFPSGTTEASPQVLPSSRERRM